MTPNPSFKRSLYITLLGSVLAACGGGGGGSNGSGDSDGGGGSNSSQLLSSLSGDADNHDLLYFTLNIEREDGTGESSLMAVNPADMSDIHTTELTIRDVYNANDLGRAAYVPLYEADISQDDNSVSEYRVAKVAFLHNREAGAETSEGFASVSTDVNSLTTPLDATRASSESYLNAGLSGAGALIRQNYADATHASVTYGLPGSMRHMRFNFPADVAPYRILPAIVDYVTPVGKLDQPGTQTYLALRNSDNSVCNNGYFLVRALTYSLNLGSNGSTVDNLLPNGREAAGMRVVAGPVSNGNQYLIIDTVAPAAGGKCTAEAGTLWRYNESLQPSLVQLTNDAGEPLELPSSVTGLSRFPEARHTAVHGDTVFFGIADIFDLNQQHLYRINGDQWDYLAEDQESLGFSTGFITTSSQRVAASVGNKVISWNHDGTAPELVDESSATWLGIMTEALGSRDGWIFFNRADINGKDHAVAAKIDGSDTVAVPNAQWIGASSTGNGDSVSNIKELSEVFMWRGNDILATSAADPKAGLMRLGTLATTPENVTMYGLAPGPHRLIQVHTSNDSADVYYANTRETDSLHNIMGDRNEGGIMRPVNGF
ncbi:hypothetical protein [Spongiibacter sp.]|mgnify:CR=1 FL=1|uniref:hypothetical protein n=1 Tax=Spongiibacter sp. TaxID=2024860 RepID=UPI000C3C85E8|nr:hypothetical protein [Spongiibacter sp.]MBU72999.1 hypothetical protein [Spongiibacter sp.]MBU73477.1 hypothetical protein [Spongiibacter sp.]